MPNSMIFFNLFFSVSIYSRMDMPNSAFLEKSHIFCKWIVSKILQSLNAFWSPWIIDMLSQRLGCSFDSLRISSLFSQSWPWSKFLSQYSAFLPEHSSSLVENMTQNNIKMVRVKTIVKHMRSFLIISC